MKSTRVHRLTGSAITALVASVLALGTPQASQGVTEQDAYKELGTVTVKDGVKISYMVYRPKKEGRYPVLVQYDPYASGGLPWSDPVKDYLNAGYAIVGANVRGAGCSGGAFSLFQPLEGEDGAQLIDHLGAQPWSTGAVGMVGNSYPGHTQILTGANRPTHLKALAAGGLTSSIYREAFRPGGIMNVGFSSRWSFLGQPNGSRTAAENRIKMGDSECEAVRAAQPPNRTFYDTRDHPMHDEWWDARALDTYVGRVNVPMMIVQGWQDHQTAVSGGPRLFEQLNVPKKMILQTGGHGVYRRAPVRAEVIRWMDRWLKNEQNGIEKEPQVTVWFDVADPPEAPAKPAWSTTFSSWPIKEATWQTMYLTADGKLTPTRPTAAPEIGDRVYTFPTGTELAGNNVQFAVPPDASGALIYRSAPMTEDVTVIGSIQATFHVTTEQKDTDFMLVLHDVAPNGDTLYLQRGFLRASVRATDPAKSAPHRLFHPFKKVEALVPGQRYEIKMSLPPVGHVFRQGHTVEFAILAPSATPTPDWGPMPVDMPGRNTVHHSADAVSSIMLPVVPGMKAQASPPPCGSLEFQPCRFAPPRTTTTAAGR